MVFIRRERSYERVLTSDWGFKNTLCASKPFLHLVKKQTAMSRVVPPACSHFNVFIKVFPNALSETYMCALTHEQRRTICVTLDVCRWHLVTDASSSGWQREGGDFSGPQTKDIKKNGLAYNTQDSCETELRTFADDNLNFVRFCFACVSGGKCERRLAEVKSTI